MLGLAVLFVAVAATSAQKPGSCPAPAPTPGCTKKCVDDFSCPGTEKCCSTTCGGFVTACRPPVCPLNCPVGYQCQWIRPCPFCNLQPQCVRSLPQCPFITTCSFPSNECLNDFQCGFGRYCCRTPNCGNRCSVPLFAANSPNPGLSLLHGAAGPLPHGAAAPLPHGVAEPVPDVPPPVVHSGYGGAKKSKKEEDS